MMYKISISLKKLKTKLNSIRILNLTTKQRKVKLKVTQRD